jgi:hypothetical protein
MNASYPDVGEESRWESRVAMFRAVQQAVDRERGASGKGYVR